MRWPCRSCQAILPKEHWGDNPEATEAEALSGKGLAYALECTLALGNFMNGGTHFGSAAGIEVHWIAQVVNTRSNRTHESVITYVVHLLADVAPEQLAFHQVLLPILLRARRIDSADLEELVESLNTTIQLVKRSIEKEPVIEDICGKTVDDNFRKTAENFVSMWQLKIEGLQAEFQRMTHELEALVLLFCTPTAKDETAKDVFNHLSIFLTVYETCFNDLIAQKDREARQKRLEARKAAAQATNRCSRDEVLTKMKHSGPRTWGIEGVEAKRQSMRGSTTMRSTMEDSMNELQSRRSSHSITSSVDISPFSPEAQ